MNEWIEGKWMNFLLYCLIIFFLFYTLFLPLFFYLIFHTIGLIEIELKFNQIGFLCISLFPAISSSHTHPHSRIHQTILKKVQGKY